MNSVIHEQEYNIPYIIIYDTKYCTFPTMLRRLGQIFSLVASNAEGFRPEFLLVDLQSRLGCKDQESKHSSTTPDTGYQWESGKLTVRHHKRETRGQPFPSRRPQGTHKQTRTEALLQSQDKKKIRNRSTTWERSVKIFYWRA